VVVVADGVLRVAHAEALNGADVSFASGTSLEIAYESNPASDLARRGVVLLREGSRLSIADATLPVSVTDVPADVNVSDFTAGIVTLGTKSDAETIAQRLLVTARIGEKTRRAVLSVGGNEAGGYTVQADFSPSGLMIFVR
jgi:hypothetical protein